MKPDPETRRERADDGSASPNPARPSGLSFAFGHVPTEPFEKHLELVLLAEDLGFDSAWLADQTFYRDPYSLLTLLAANTKKITLGLGVTNPYTRNPAMAARAIATIAELAPGRVRFGIGAGNRKELLDPLRLEAGGTALRIKEMALISRGLIEAGEVNYEGVHYSAKNVSLEFTPPSVPIYVAGRGRRVLEVAGEVADGAIIGGLCTPAGVNYALDAITKGSSRRGWTPTDLHIVSWVMCVITDDPDVGRDRIRPTIAHIMGGAPRDLLEHLTISDSEIDSVKETYVVHGKDHAADQVSDFSVDAFSIVGTPDDFLQRVSTLRNAGIDELSILMNTGTTENHAQSLRGIAHLLAQNPVVDAGTT